MLPEPFARALVLTGPTGSGKSRLGVDLALRLDAEIISMDSMALYRGMDIGTAKPNCEERRLVLHHLIDALEPWESASVAWWLEHARRCCREIEGRGKQVLFVGGTPLYLKALMFGLFDAPPADQDLRRRLDEEADRFGNEAMHARLSAVDPEAGARLHANDRRRVLRALEVFELTGKPISSWQEQWPSASSAYKLEAADFPFCLWLDLPRPMLYERIDRRVEAMFAEGLVEECRRLIELEKPLSIEASQALGYREVFAYLHGQATLEATIRAIQKHSRNLAKRQMTWFRHLPGCRPATSQLTWTLWQSRIKA